MSNLTSKKKTIESNIRIRRIIRLLAVITCIAIVPELVARNFPIKIVSEEYLQNISTLSFNSLIVFGLFAGTVISFAKFENNGVKYGFSANERVLFLNQNKFLNANLLEILIVNYLLIPVAFVFTIFNFHNSVVSVFILSIVLTLIEFLMALNVMVDRDDDIDLNCQNRIRREIENGDASSLEKMLSSFNSKIDRDFLFSTEYKFFVEIVTHEGLAIEYPEYYRIVQRLISNQIYEKKLEMSQIVKLTQDLMFNSKIPVVNRLIIYIDEAVLWSASNFSKFKVSELFWIFKFCSLKLTFKEHSEYHLRETMQNLFIIRLNIEENRLMNKTEYNKTVSELEKRFVELATLKDNFCNLRIHDTDIYLELDEECISYHQIPLFNLIKYYLQNKDWRLTRIFDLLNRRKWSDSKAEICSDAKLKKLLFLKISYYLYASSKLDNNSEEKKFISDLVSYKESATATSFQELVRKMHFDEVVDIRKDMGYDLFLPINVRKECMDEIKYLISLSILKGFTINFKNLTFRELESAYEMFDRNGGLSESSKEYLKGVSEFYGIDYSEIKSETIFNGILDELKLYPSLFEYVSNKEKYSELGNQELAEIFEDRLIY